MKVVWTSIINKLPFYILHCSSVWFTLLIYSILIRGLIILILKKDLELSEERIIEIIF